MGVPGYGKKKGCIDTKAPVMLWIIRGKAQLTEDVSSLAPGVPGPTIPRLLVIFFFKPDQLTQYQETHSMVKKNGMALPRK